MMKRNFSLVTFISVLAALAIDFSASGISAQVESSALSFNRGKLWQSVYNGKVGPQFSNWRKIGIGLDWPGFEPSWVAQDIGGAASYMASGGLYVGCKKTNDSVLVAEDWCISGGTVAPEADAKYRIVKHTHLFKDGANYWLKSDPLKGEEVIETIWEFNTQYTDNAGIRRQLPVRVKRSAHNWSGSMDDENYILYEYVIKNISDEIKTKLLAEGNVSRAKVVPDTLKEFYALLTYALHANSRAWTVNFPTEPAGAKNTQFYTEPKNNLIYGRADDYLATSVQENKFGHSYAQGLLIDGEPQGEFLAPGFVGYSLIYSSPNTSGAASKVNKYGWSAGDNSFDFSGPFANMDTEESQYNILKDPSKAKNPVSAPNDTLFMRRSRMWSMMSVGPWNLAPGDSVVIAVAEIVDGVDDSVALDAKDELADKVYNIQKDGKKSFDLTLKKAKFTYEQRLANRGFNHPDPPAAPRFDIGFWSEREQFVANFLTWGTSTEGLPDPDDGIPDLAGYKLYRSAFLPTGPWKLIGTVTKGDPKYFKAEKNRYEYVDSTVDVGIYYYYALTAFDNGRTSWNINNGGANPYNPTGSGTAVGPMESSIFANRFAANSQFNQPFLATPPAPKNLDNTFVVPNPAVGALGVTQGAGLDQIQFVNIPNPCTIRIYTVRGDLVKTINVPGGNGAIYSWDQSTDYGQWVGSGIYIYHIESALGNKIGKLAIVK